MVAEKCKTLSCPLADHFKPSYRNYHIVGRTRIQVAYTMSRRSRRCGSSLRMVD